MYYVLTNYERMFDMYVGTMVDAMEQRERRYLDETPRQRERERESTALLFSLGRAVAAELAAAP